MTLGERLRKARRTAKYTQEEISKKLGIDFTTVSKWENDKAPPNVETLRTLAELYKVTLAHLLDDNPDDDLYKDLDPELVEALKNASPENREHFHKYLRGEVSEPVFYTQTEKALTRDLESGMDLLELMEKYTFTIGGIEPTREELEQAMKYIKASRIMNMM